MPETAEIPEVEKVLAEMPKPLHQMVKVIRDHHSISIAEAIDKFGGPGIRREYRKIVEKLHNELHTPDLGGEG